MVTYRGENLTSFLGYAGQLSRALFHVLEEQKEVHIEKEDDTSVIDNDGTIIKLEQLKTIDDKVLKYNSKDFIGTLHNWLDVYLKSASLMSNTKYVLFLENHNEQDVIIKQCHAASNKRQAGRVVDTFLRKINWETEANKKRAATFLNNRDKLSHIITNFSVQHPKSSSSENDINEYIISNFEDSLDSELPRFVDELKGTFYSKVINSDKKIQKSIFKRSFINEFMLAFGGHNKVLSLPKVSDLQKKIQFELSSRYVDQLKIIGCDNELVKAAMKARIEWSILEDNECKHGISTPKNFNEMYSNMKERWLENKSAVLCSSHLDDNQKGIELYNQSIKEDIIVDKVAFKDQRRVSRGVHNHMANFKDSIGWHPNFEEELRKKKNGNQ